MGAVARFFRVISLYCSVLPLILMVPASLWAADAYAAATTTPGTMQGQFSVSRTGAATYQIPIDVPPGANGLKPSLALLYNSQGGNGLLGKGWSLSGLSLISRCPQTIAQDNAVHLPDLSSADRFCLDGQRLIHVGTGSYGDPGTTYRTEIESFQLVTASSTQTGQAPSSFTVVDRAGLTRVYSTVVKGGDGVTPLVWLVTKITDRYNNTINFHYTVTSDPYYGVSETVSSIDYGAKSKTIAQIQFTYNGGQGTRQDSYSQYVTHTLVTRNNQTLTGIAVADSVGNTLRTYTLSYRNGARYGAATLLTSVKECAGDNWCFKPTTFGYSGSDPSFDFTAYAYANVDVDYKVGDFDGDGLPDYFCYNPYSGKFFVVFGSNYNWQTVDIAATAANSTTDGIGFDGSVVIDLFGDGRQEVLVPYFPDSGNSDNYAEWKMLVYNQGTLKLVPVPNPSGHDLYACADYADGCSVDAIAVDVDHKGQQSLLFNDGGRLYMFRNSGGVLSDYADPTQVSGLGLVNGGHPSLTPVNYSNSGQPEIYVAGNGVVAWNPNIGQWGNFYMEAAGNFDDANSIVRIIDADGSGLSSVVKISGGNWSLFQNTGSGFLFYSSPGSSGFNYINPPVTMINDNIVAVDWYGDGRQELAVRGIGGVLYLFQPDTLGGSFISTGVQAQGTAPSDFIDVDGDGEPDLLSLYATTPGSMRTYYNKAQPYLLDVITDGLGHNTNVGYVPLDAAAHGAYVQNGKPKNYVAPTTLNPIDASEQRTFLSPMYLVDAYAVDSGILGSGSQPEQLFTYYLYSGSKVDVWGRGFLGFSEVEAINANSNLYTDVTYNQAFPYIGMPDITTKSADASLSTPNSQYLGETGIAITCAFSSASQADTAICTGPSNMPITFDSSQTGHAGNVIISKIKNHDSNDNGFTDAYAGSAGYPNVYSPYISWSETDSYDLDSHQIYEKVITQSTNKVVATGTPIGTDVMPTDVTVSTYHVGASGDSQSVHTHNDYGQDSTCPGHPTAVTLTHAIPADPDGTSSNDLTVSESFVYDGQCFLTSDVKPIVDYAGNTKGTLTKTYAPDTYGNPLTSTVSDGTTSRKTTMVYDLTKRFPVSITNALGQVSESTYDIWGHKRTDTDVNGNTVTFKYDSFAVGADASQGLGVLMQRKGPLSADDKTTWAYGFCTSGCRTVSAYSVTEIGPDNSSKTTEYDELARVVRNSHVGFNSEDIVQDTDYDVLGRVASTSTPHVNGTAGCWDVKIFDVLGRVVSEYQPITTAQCSGSGSASDQDPRGERSTTYQYSGMQVIKTISDLSGATAVASEQTTTKLNVLGKPASVIDPVGTTTYGYDQWGNLTSTAPPGQAAMSMTYDSAGDKLTLRDPDMGAWTYGYDAYGELTSQVDANGHLTTTTYDSLGRTQERDEADGVTRWVYDIAYGAGVGKLAYTYGSNGVWEGYAYDPFGETTDKITVVGGQEYWVTTDYTDVGQVSQVLYPDMTAINVNAAPVQPSALSVAVDSNDATLFHLGWHDTAQAGQIYHLYRTGSAQTLPTDPTQLLQYEIYSGPISSWIDGTITKDDTYTWWVTACSGSNTNCSPYANASLTVVLPPTVPGTPVASAQGAQTTNNWTVTWLASTLGSTGTPCPIIYTLQQKLDNGAFTQVGQPITQACGTNPDSVTANVTGGDGTYTYQVDACAGGVCSLFSPISTPVTVHIQPGQVVMNLPASYIATTYNSNIPVTFNAPAVNGGPGNVVYTVTQVTTRQITIDGKPVTVPAFPVLGTTTSTTYPDTANAGTDGTYTYEVQACDANDNTLCGPMSAQASMPAIFPPKSPASTTITVPSSDSNVPSWQVSWTPASLQNGGTAQLTYDVEEYRGGTRIATYTGQATNSMSTTAHHTDGIYTYDVRACSEDDSVLPNVKDCTPYTAQSSGYTTVIAPAVPTNVSLPSTTNLDGTFTVTWTEPATAGRITSSSGTLGEWDTERQQYMWIDGHCSGPDSTASASCHPTTNGPLYVLIQACNTDDAVESGVTVCSNPSGIAGPINVNMPSPPTLSGGGNQPDGSDTLTWSTVTGVGHYMFYSRTQSLSTGAWSAWSNPGTNVGAATSKAVTLTSAQSAGQYYVQACDSVSCTGNSNVRTLTHTVPVAPSLTGPSSTPDGNISISWNAPIGATSYQLWRSAEKNNAWLAYAQVTPSGRAYTEKVGVLTQAVRYYVQACNVIGCSGQSNTLIVSNNEYGTGCPPPPLQCQLMMEDDDGPSLHPMRFGANSMSKPRAAAELLEPLDDLRVISSAKVISDTDAELTASSAGAVAKAIPQSTAGYTERTPVFTAGARPEELVALSPVQPFDTIAMASVQAPLPAEENGPSARQAFFLAHADDRSIKMHLPARGMRLAGSLAGTVRLAPAIDPRLSMYPPLRKDPRIMAHFVAMGGQAPDTVNRVDCGTSDADGDCSEPPPTMALMVGYVYNSNGYLAEVRRLDDSSPPNPTQVLWHANGMDALGHVNQEAFDLPCSGQTCSSTGETVDVSNTFDQASGLLKQTSASAVTANSTLNASYTWDGYNNLLNRTATQTVTTGVAAAALNESFSYDAENRLCDMGTAGGTCSAASMVTYDSTEKVRIKSNGIYTGYTYEENTQTESLPDGTTYSYTQPHAVTSLLADGQPRSFKYDFNGNLTDETGDVARHIDWTSFDKPADIHAGGVTESFVYGPSRERLVTSVMNGTHTVTTTYIDGLFEMVTDSAANSTTYRHYVVAGDTRVAVETVQVNSSGQTTSDTLGFFVHDQVGSVIATITEDVGRTGQQMTVYSHDVWGKARPASGAQALQDPPEGTYLTGAVTMAGQHEGFASHEDLEDIGIVDMEGRIYDPELGRFLSADSVVQNPDSGIGYDRYAYVGDNPLSLNDPTGHMSFAVAAAATLVISYVAGPQTGASFMQAYMTGYMSGQDTNAIAGQWAISEFEGAAFDFIGHGVGFSDNPVGGELFARSVMEGIVGGAYSLGGGGRFGDGFLGAFASSESYSFVNEINISGSESMTKNMRTVASAIIGGITSSVAGGDFSAGALAGKLQRENNDNNAPFSPVPGYSNADLQQQGQAQEAKQEAEAVQAEKVDELGKRYTKEYDRNATGLQKRIGVVEQIQRATVGSVARKVGGAAALSTGKLVLGTAAEVQAATSYDRDLVEWDARATLVGKGFKWYSGGKFALGLGLDIGDGIYSAGTVITGYDGGTPIY